MEDVDMEMQDVEPVGHPSDLVEHDDVVGNRVLDARIKSQGDLAAGLQARGSLRVSAGKEGHIVSPPHQFFSQIRNNPFCPAI
jgi:hypothetical protein